MTLSDKAVAEFRAIHLKETGEELDDSEAREVAENFMTFFIAISEKE
jgi:hypothetical protein